MSENAVIFGYSGHAYVILELLAASGVTATGYFDAEEKQKNPFNLTYRGTGNDETDFAKITGDNAYIAIGNNQVRARIFDSLERNKISCPVAVHPKATISPSVKIGAATVVMAGAVINAMATVGKAVICNTSCVIEHECIICDHAHIGPGAVLAGNVKVGAGTFIGANSVVKQGTTIGAGVTVGAGSVIVSDIPDGVTIFGNPAKVR